MIKITKETKLFYRIMDEKNWNHSIHLTKQELKSLHTKIGKILGIVDFKKEMVEDKCRFIGKKVVKINR